MTDERCVTDESVQRHSSGKLTVSVTATAAAAAAAAATSATLGGQLTTVFVPPGSTIHAQARDTIPEIIVNNGAASSTRTHKAEFG